MFSHIYLKEYVVINCKAFKEFSIMHESHMAKNKTVFKNFLDFLYIPCIAL